MALPIMDFDEIEPRLYLSDFNTANDRKTLKNLNVTHVLTASYFPPTCDEDVKTLFFDVNDTEDSDLLTKFEESNKFIEEGQKAGACLVHCMCGISRSATLVTAYLMKKYSISVKEATFKVKGKRIITRPNDGFVRQLQLYEEMKFTLDINNPQYKLYVFQQLKNKEIRGDSLFMKQHEKMFSSDPTDKQIKCKKCRSFLFSESDRLKHYREKKISWRDTFPYDELNVCQDEFVMFIQSFAWIKNALTEANGLIHCPKCETKLGEFNWNGITCTCNAHVQPAFKIVISNVDCLNTGAFRQ